MGVVFDAGAGTRRLCRSTAYALVGDWHPSEIKGRLASSTTDRSESAMQPCPGDSYGQIRRHVAIPVHLAEEVGNGEILLIKDEFGPHARVKGATRRQIDSPWDGRKFRKLL